MAEYAVSVGGREYTVAVERGGDRLRVTVDGHAHEVAITPWLGSTHYVLARGSARTPVVIRRQGDERLVGIGDEQYRVRIARRVPIARQGGAPAAGARDVTSPMPGLVVSVEVAAGDAVHAGQAVATIEAMKMHSEIRAPLAGRVGAVRVQAGQEVMGGAVLLTIEPSG